MVEIRLDNGKLAGTVENGVFVKKVIFQKHFFRKGKGYSISVSVLNLLKKHGVKEVEIQEHRKAGDYVYRVGTEAYFSAPLFKYDGLEEQRCLPLENMRVVSEKKAVSK